VVSAKLTRRDVAGTTDRLVNVQWQQAAVCIGGGSGAGSWRCGRDVPSDSLVALATLRRTW
jgi:hypothetical protein